MRRASLTWVGACIVLPAWAQPAWAQPAWAQPAWAQPADAQSGAGPVDFAARLRRGNPGGAAAAQVVPPLTTLAIGAGAHADNTGGNSLALVGDLKLNQP